MPRMSELRTVVENFTNQLAQVIEAQIMERARRAVAVALGGNGIVPARRGRPPKSLALAPVFSAASLVAKMGIKKPRKKAPKQLCPVPGCSNPAAPVFGMVCAKHKDVSKLKIRKYREARRAKKDTKQDMKKSRPITAAKKRRVIKRRKKIAAPKKPAAAPAAVAAPAA
jgi:hypothetical protein